MIHNKDARLNMRLTKTAEGKIKVCLSRYPIECELKQLNDLNRGLFWIRTARGYKELLHSQGDGPSYTIMECPINETFTV